MPFGLSPIHIIAALAIGLVILGPRRLPKLGAGAGRWIREFREGAVDAKESFVSEVAPANATRSEAPTDGSTSS